MSTAANIESETTSQQGPPQEHPEHARPDGRHLAMHRKEVRVPIPYFTPGDLAATTRGVAFGTKIAASRLPKPPAGKEILYYGGLGALTVAGAIEWPVALAVAGATWLLRGRREPGEEHVARPEGERKPADVSAPATAPAPQAAPQTEPGTVEGTTS